MKWNDDMSLAPAGEEWVLGAVEIDPGNSDSLTYEMVIFDSGHWTNTSGAVVSPLAWARVDEYRPSCGERGWADRDSLEWAFQCIDDWLPEHIYSVGIALANSETGEGAFVLDSTNRDLESAIHDADVKKDILHDATRIYDDAVSFLHSSFDGAKRH